MALLLIQLVASFIIAVLDVLMDYWTDLFATKIIL